MCLPKIYFLFYKFTNLFNSLITDLPLKTIAHLNNYVIKNIISQEGDELNDPNDVTEIRHSDHNPNHVVIAKNGYLYGSQAFNISQLSEEPSCYKCSNKTKSYIDSLKYDLYKRIEFEVNRGIKNFFFSKKTFLELQFNLRILYCLELPLAGLDFTSKRLSQESVHKSGTENFDMLYSKLSENSNKLKSSQKNLDLMNSLRNKFLI